jgi:hypothetical protein
VTVLRRFLILTCAAAALAAASPVHGARLQTGLLDPHVEWGQGIPEIGIPAGVAFSRTRGGQNWGAGGSVVRLYMYWRDVAPTKPHNATGGYSRADARNPAYAAYRWAHYDAIVRSARARGLQVIFSIVAAPEWAETGDPPCGGKKGLLPCAPFDIPPGTWKPNAVMFGDFAHAAALRYSGSFPGLENQRVRYWQAWNESNYYGFLNPQRESFTSGENVSVNWYREMLREFAAGVRAADRTYGGSDKAVVVTSSLAPFGSRNVTYPKTFMRKLLCLDGQATLPCAAPVPFDAWAAHPYSYGSPSWHTLVDANVSIADLPAVRALLRQAHERGHVSTASGNLAQLWVTEFNWDAKPPDPCGAPSGYHARWTSEALYRFWRYGVTVAVWTQLRDYPRSFRDPSTRKIRYWYYQGGLYRWGSDLDGATDRPRLTLRAFRFPFVAYRGTRTVSVWGKTTLGVPRTVTLQRRTATGRWRSFATVTSSDAGVFRRTFRTRMTGWRWLRAVVPRRDHSAPFSLVRPPELVLVYPFGC